MAVKSCCTENLGLVLKAANFAAIRHREQRRKNSDSTPYINHPIGVAHIIMEEGKVSDPAVIAAALLHDTVEDTETSPEEIKTEFGEEIAGIVAEVTDDKTLPKEERKRLQVVTAPKKTWKAKQVKLADKLYNLRDMEKAAPIGWTEERVKEYFQWAKSVVDGLRGANPELEKSLDEVFARNGISLGIN